MSTTQKDLAARLGVSQITVSRALRGESNVKPALREKILSAAGRAGYSIDASNFAARMMRQHAGAAAVQRLQRRIKLPDEPRKKLVLETELIEGETVGPPPGWQTE